MRPAPPEPAAGLGLYVHLPFCPGRCPYCDFFAQPFDAAAAQALARAMLDHLPAVAEMADGRRLATVYVGGGTPSMWPVRFLGGLLEAVERTIGLEANPEISLEANPGTLGPAKLRLIAASGVNRLSLGAQSFQPALLQALGRRHGPEQTIRVVEQARRAGLENLSVDLIYGLPGQDAALAVADVEAAIALEPDHLSLYELTLGPQTPFGRHYVKGRPPLPDEDALAAMEAALLKRLAATPLQRYEVSNFARPGRQCRHNQDTWRGHDYLALGPGAHGHLAGRRFAFHADVGRYVAEVAAGRQPLAFEEALTADQRALELFMLGLRAVEGVDLTAVARLLGADPAGRHGPALAEVVKRGWATARGKRLRPTPAGLAMADAAAALFA